jgi:putative SOS response-associated peptidase YedK
MGGRCLLLAIDPEAVARHCGLDSLAEPALAPRYNIAPTQQVAVVRGDGGWRLAMLRWGLVAAWTKAPLINARSETVFEKSAFRAAMLRRRCLVPSSGFYEWKAVGKLRHPHLFQLRDGGLTAFAGIWEGEAVAFLTMAANDLVRPFTTACRSSFPRTFTVAGSTRLCRTPRRGGRCWRPSLRT